MIFETARGTVHAWQCEHMGHANLRAYGEFFEQALWQLFFHLGLTPSQTELLPGDLILVESRLLEPRERTLKMAHDPQTRKPKPFPPEVTAKAKELL